MIYGFKFSIFSFQFSIFSLFGILSIYKFDEDFVDAVHTHLLFQFVGSTDKFQATIGHNGDTVAVFSLIHVVGGDKK